jgi:hypothetical protein
MQYIQTSSDSYLFNVLEALEATYTENEVEYKFDYDEFDQYLNKDDWYSMFMMLAQLPNIHKLDKKGKERQ